MESDVREWLDGLQLGQYADLFAENAVDFDLLAELTDPDLEKIGIAALGHRKRILRAIAGLGDPETAGGPASIPPTSREQTPGAERRNLTVMFVDLVGSTALAASLDPEEMREVIRTYQDTVTAEVGRFGGHVAKYTGDGVLAYFGYPKAHEDDAERAVQAGLAVVDAVGRLSFPENASPHARVGIATGLVVVGDLIGEGAAREEAVVGETPNLAARLQESAVPDAVVVAPGTHRLIGGLFEWADLGAQRLKGLEEPVQAWRALRQRAAESRFDARHGSGVTPLVGRQHEVGLMQDRWQMARAGEGQVMLLQGEPGIGKSRLLHALSALMVGEAHTRLRYQCSPFRSNSALFPVAEQLEHAAGFVREDGAAQKLSKLEMLLARSSNTLAEVIPLFAALLSVPTGDRYPPLDLAPQRKKEQTLGAIVDQLEGLARDRPVLMTFEDVHWIDPTSQELLDLAIERVRGLPAFLVITFRPEFSPRWSGHTHVTALTLNRLGRRQAAALIERRTGGKPLPEEVVAQIVEKTDGVPLFVEELTNTVLDAGFLRDAGDRYVLAGPLQPLSIPTTLHDSLMARLDRHAPVKEVAQIGSVLGREFSHELLAAVADVEGGRLAGLLDQLLGAELIFRRGRGTETSYIFKHALVQDAAYQSLLRSRRRFLHARVAERLRDSFPEVVERQPELVAHHLTEAGEIENAITYWRRAGEQAAERSAYVEAMAHLTRGLELLKRLSESEARDQAELSIQLALGPVYMSTGGWAAPEVEPTYIRARELSRRAGEPGHYFTVTWNLWHLHQTRSDVATAKSLAEELLGLAREAADAGLMLQAHHAAWTTQYHMGELPECYQHTEQGRVLYDAATHRGHKFRFGGHDPGVCARNHGACTLWLLGHPEKAVNRSREGLALGRDLEHPMTLLTALVFSSFVHQFRRDLVGTRELGEVTVMTCDEHGVAPHFRATGAIMSGWAKAAQGQNDGGLALMRQGLDELRALGVDVRRSYFLAMLAETLARTGCLDEAWLTLQDVEALIARSGERRWEAEANRLRGELLLARHPAERHQAEACFFQALDIARRQTARSLELRAATGLASLWAKEGRKADARDLLSPVYEWFTEGLDTPDLMDAEALLGNLSA